MYILFLALSGWIVFQLTLPFFTVLASRIAGRERLNTVTPPPPPRDYACIITAYKNAAITLPLIRSLLQQRSGIFHIYVVADECPPGFDPRTDDGRVSVFQPPAPLRLKLASIRYATERFVRPHNYVLIFDSDNLAHPDFLSELDRYAAAGYRVIQGRRTAKNTNNHIAAADSLGEIYKNYTERYATWLLGSSAVISGSAMATHIDLYLAHLNSPEVQNGWSKGRRALAAEDKILQSFLLKKGETIAFAKNAVCYDEKVQTGAAVETQRSRWLYAYFQNLPNTLQILVTGLLHANWNQFFFGLATSLLPMFIQVALAFVLFLIGLLVAPAVSLMIAVAGWVFVFTVFWTLYLSGESAVARQAMTAVPGFIWRQARALLKMSNPNKNFVPTQHTEAVQVDDVMKQDK